MKVKIERVFLGEVAASGEAPTEFKLLSQGVNATRKGNIVFDDIASQMVMEQFSLGGVDLPIDYDHAMADPCSDVDERIAAGWFKPEVRDGDLYMSEIGWTDQGKASVESKQWRYTSLYGDVAPINPEDPESDCRLVRLRNVALCNLPATMGTLPLVAHEDAPKAEPEAPKAEPAKEPAKVEASELADIANVLGVAPNAGAVMGALTALKVAASEGEKALTELAAIKKAEADAIAKAEADRLAQEKAGLIKSLSDSGKLPPSLHAWAETQTIESLKAYGEHAPTLVPTTETVKDNGGETLIGLTDDEIRIASLFRQDLGKLAEHKAKFSR